jgi:hypothetical protein
MGGISNPVEQIQPSMQISFDDMISQNESEMGDSKPATARSQRVNKSRMMEGVGAFNGLFVEMSINFDVFREHPPEPTTCPKRM